MGGWAGGGGWVGGSVGGWVGGLIDFTMWPRPWHSHSIGVAGVRDSKKTIYYY